MRRFAVSAAVLILSAHAACAAETTRVDTAYTVYLTGIPVGNAKVSIELSETGFIATGSAKTSGFIRIISKGEGTANVRGSFQANRITSSTFSARLKTGKHDEKIELSVVNGFAKEFSTEPPRPSHADRVPITSEARTNIVDPLSAMLALVSAKGDVLSPETCNRTLPIFDGRYRFNIVLTYLRTEKAAKAEGYQGPALVCQARYVPIAGHRDRQTVQQMAENRDMLVWLAPVSGTRVLAPIKASISSTIGTFVVEATRFRVGAR